MIVAAIAEYRGLWIADVPTAYGHMELLCGEEQAPEIPILLLAERFFDGDTDHIAAIRRSAFRLPLLWRPIRLAVNNEGRLGLQFKNRFTGRQEGMFFADEHSTFRENLSSIRVSAQDTERWRKCCTVGWQQ